MLIAICLFSLFAPGWLISRFVDISLEGRILFSFASSYSLFALLFIVASYFGWSSEQFNNFYGVLIVSCSLVCVLEALGREMPQPVAVLADGVFIAIFVLVYQMLVGPYDQLPADVYAHLVRYQNALTMQADGGLGPQLAFHEYFLQKSAIWYHFVASLNSFVGEVSVERVHSTITLITKSVFLYSVYCFGRVIFNQYRLARAMAMTATLLLAMHMGVNVFAYIRYYSFAPTILAYVIYLSAIAYFVEDMSKGRIEKVWKSRAVLFLTLTLFIASLCAIHIQEALFVLVMITGVSLAAVTSQFFDSKSSVDRRYLYILLSFASGFFLLHFLAISTFERSPNIAWRLWDFGVMLQGFPRVTVLNPKFQFMEVVTFFGLSIYGVSIIFYWRIVKQNFVLMCCFIVPLITVFNPFFVDFFVRAYQVTVLYRVLYALPLHYLGAILFVNLFQAILDAESFHKKLIFLLSLVALVGPMFVPKFGSVDNFTRWESLRAVNEAQGMRQFSDLGKYLVSIPPKTVITDPIAGYYIAATTHHRYLRKNFLSNYTRFTFQDYSSHPLKMHKGKLLVINKRDHEESRTGKLSGHWPETIFNVSKYYPPRLTEYISESPTMFELVWSSEASDIMIYELK